jgi:hypothetical protein
VPFLPKLNKEEDSFKNYNQSGRRNEGSKGSKKGNISTSAIAIKFMSFSR